MHKVKGGTALKDAGVILGVVSAIAVAAAIARKAFATSGSENGLKPADTTSGGDGLLLDDPINAFGSGGSGGIVQQPNERLVTVASHPVEVVRLSDDPLVREQTIKSLSEQTGTTGKENITGVKTGTRSDSFGNKDTIYYTPEGKILTNKQEVFDDYLEQTFTSEVRGVFTSPNTKQVSVLQSLQSGKPVNVTNFLTERPAFLPEAKSDTTFLRRAQALKPTLTVGNPGASSSAAVPNFSRLAALGVDLSKVDILRVQNPSFLGSIKSGQGPLTAAQKVLIDQERLRIDPRNQTSSVTAAIRANQARNAAASAARAARASQLTPGFNEAQARAFLKSKGFNVTGTLTPATFASLEVAIKKRGL